ncbi:MAG TPA: hypothetical protein VJN64_02305, partial [Terriglobales bacterium]|nr:hypothetical protein [Terriglobales bacterium]
MPGAQHRSGGGELRLPPGRVQVVNIEQLADALDDGNARRGWFLDNYNAYTQACTQAELAVES